MSRERSKSPSIAAKNADMEVDPHSPADKPDTKVIVVTNLTRNVVESHLKTIFGFYGHITKIDLPVFGKCAYFFYYNVTNAYISLAGQNRGKAALEFADSASAQKAASHMDGGQLDSAIVKVELSQTTIVSPSRSPVRAPPRGPRTGRDRPRSFSRSRSRTRSRTPPPANFRRRGPRGDSFGARDRDRESYRGRPYGRRGPPGRDVYRPNRSRTRSRSPIRRSNLERPPPPRRRSPSYTRGGYGRRRSRSYSVRSSRSGTRSPLSRSRSRSMSYSSDSRYSRSRSRTRSLSGGRRSRSRDDIRDSRSRSPGP